MTDWNATFRLQGRTDIPLNSTGVGQARQVALAVENLPQRHGHSGWNALYSSPMERAHQTAQQIQQVISVSPILLDDLVERSFGVLEGRTREEVDESFPDWRHNEEQIDGLETKEQLRERVMGVLDYFSQRPLGEVAVVVTHGGFLRTLFSLLPPSEHDGESLTFSNCGYSLVTYDGKWKVLDVNVTDHLM